MARRDRRKRGEEVGYGGREREGPGDVSVSLLERFNQVHISAVNHKRPTLVCGSQRGAGEQAEASLFRPLPLERGKNIWSKQTSAEHTPPPPPLPPCMVLSTDLYLCSSFFLMHTVNHSPYALSQLALHYHHVTSAFVSFKKNLDVFHAFFPDRRRRKREFHSH